MSSEYSGRKLSYLLRHDCRYCYEDGGWRLVADLVGNHSFTMAEIEALVSSDPKGRYELNEDKSKVRARYGHCTTVRDSVLKPA